jgi:hypothetical protein
MPDVNQNLYMPGILCHPGSTHKNPEYWIFVCGFIHSVTIERKKFLANLRLIVRGGTGFVSLSEAPYLKTMNISGETSPPDIIATG